MTETLPKLRQLLRSGALLAAVTSIGAITGCGKGLPEGRQPPHPPMAEPPTVKPSGDAPVSDNSTSVDQSKGQEKEPVVLGAEERLPTYVIQGVYQCVMTVSGRNEDGGVWVFSPDGKILHIHFATGSDVILGEGAYELKREQDTGMYEITVRMGYHSGSSRLEIIEGSSNKELSGFRFIGKNGIIELRGANVQALGERLSAISGVSDFRKEQNNVWRSVPKGPNQIGVVRD